MEFIPRFLPRAFSVSELFMFSSINAYYFSFAFDSLIYRSQRQFISGCNISNVLIFTPWIFLNFSGIIHAILGQYIGLMSLVLGLGATFASISPYNAPEIIWTFVTEILTRESQIFGYMAIILSAGLLAISQLAPLYPNFIIRKAFHILAFVIFMPPIILSKSDKPRLLIFAFNCVTIFLILLEALRYGGHLPEPISRWFKYHSNGREKLPETMILTHIYLLMGCAFPPTATFILLSGGVFPAEWALWSLAGVIFLGVGDTFAAIGGKKYGKTRWRETS